MSSTRPPVTVNPRLQNTPLVASLASADFILGTVPSTADFSFSGGAVVAVCVSDVSLSNRAHRAERSSFEGRLASLGGGGANAVICFCDVDEPEQEALTYINEACFERTLVFAWTSAEVATYVLSFRDSSTMHAGLARPKQNESLQVLLDFLQTSKVMNRLDATRLSDKFQTPVQVMSATQQDLEELPQFGVVKARKMHKLLHTEFPTTRRRLEEYTAASQAAGAPPPTGLPAPPEVSKVHPPPSTAAGGGAKVFRSAAEAGAAAIFGNTARPARRLPAAPSAVSEALQRLRAQDEASEEFDDDDDAARPVAQLDRVLAQLRAEDVEED